MKFEKCNIEVNISKQSADIALGVDELLENKEVIKTEFEERLVKI